MDHYVGLGDSQLSAFNFDESAKGVYRQNKANIKWQQTNDLA